MRGKLIFLGILTLGILLVTVSLMIGVRLGRFLEREEAATDVASSTAVPTETATSMRPARLPFRQGFGA